MTDKKLRDHLVDFYGGRLLSDEREVRLVAMARRGAPRKEAVMPARSGRILTILAAAAVLVVALVGLYANRSGTDGSKAGLAVTATEREGRGPSPDSMEVPNLVAVKIHADWCARTPVVDPIFTDLTEKYGNQPILFVTLDITDDVLRRQSELLASNLQIGNAVFAEPFESGMVKLIDRSKGEVLAVLRDEAEAPTMESALAQALTDE